MITDTGEVSFDGLRDELVDVLDRLSGDEAVRFRGLVARLMPAVPVVIDSSSATAAVRPYLWLLGRLGAHGVRLTSAGYLPPAVVREAVAALGWRERWIGAANREHHTAPVLELRESARRFGLVRKHRDLLVVTKLGRSLQTDPVGLWWHVAGRLPDARGEAEADAGILLLLLAGSGTALNTAATNQLLAAGMSALGWQVSGGRAPLDGWHAFAAARDTWTCLRRVGALPEEDWGAPPAPAPPAGIQMARAALLRHPR